MRSAKTIALLSYASVVLYVVIGFLYTPYLTGTLGVSDYGIYSLTASLVGYLSLDFGIGAALARLAAKFISEGRKEKIRDLLGLTCKFFMGIDVFIIFIALVVWGYSDVIFTNFSFDELSKFKKAFIITGIFTVLNFPLLPTKGLFQAFDRVYNFVLIDFVYKIVNITSLVSALYFGFGLMGVVVANTTTNLLAQLVKFSYIYRKEKLSFNLKAKDNEIVRFIASFSTWSTLAMIADKFFFGVIPLLLAAFSNTREVAIFAIAISIEGYTLGIARSMSGIFLPRVMKMVVRGDDVEKRTELMIKVGRIQLYVVGMIVVGLIGFGKDFIYLWVGPDYDKSYYCVALVLFPCMFHLTKTIAEELLLATNNVKYRAITYACGSILSVLSIVLLSPYLGALAAAIGVFLSFVVAHNLLLDIFYEKKAGVNMLRFYKECHCRIFHVLLLCLVVAWGLQFFISSVTWMLLFLKGAIWAVCSILILWFLAFNREEKNMLLTYVSNMNEKNRNC